MLVAAGYGWSYSLFLFQWSMWWRIPPTCPLACCCWSPLVQWWALGSLNVGFGVATCVRLVAWMGFMPSWQWRNCELKMVGKLSNRRNSHYQGRGVKQEVCGRSEPMIASHHNMVFTRSSPLMMYIFRFWTTKIWLTWRTCHFLWQEIWWTLSRSVQSSMQHLSLL